MPDFHHRLADAREIPATGSLAQVFLAPTLNHWQIPRAWQSHYLSTDNIP
jgi:hypothetical protein